MRRKTLLSLGCAVLFLIAAVPTPASAVPFPTSGAPSGAVVAHHQSPPDSPRVGGLPAGWTYWNQTVDWKNYS
ncbi:MAG: hypothetical protein L3K01_05385, partial [Thermoplasmata archaeon]|nr:hypothetical protein [Thermoplasmata archaeon]